MYFVIRGQHMAVCLCVAACAVICAAIFLTGEETMAAVETAATGGGQAQHMVVIDAGHGGADGGAVAEDGTAEASINLAVAEKLEAVFTLLGQETVMVRRADVSVHSEGVEGLRNQKVSDIHNRADLVNTTENALLISIHQNSLPQVRSVHGAQVFYNTVGGAEELAETVQATLNQSINQGNEKQKKPADSSIYLMSHITAPGILVECGFLSNTQETQLLKTDAYQTRLALTVAAGYFQYESTRDCEAVETYEEQEHFLLY